MDKGGKKEFMVMKGCGACESIKKAGVCKTATCRDINTKLGNTLAKKAKIEFTPQCIIRYPNGKVVKCNTLKELKKLVKKGKKN
jgi:hypothetical protein